MLLKPKNHNLFTVRNTKTRKGEKLGYLSIILHLSPSTQNEKGVDLCPFASQACRELCLNRSGRSEMFETTQKARERKANEFLNDRKAFLKKLIEEIKFYQRKAKKQGLILCVRLNGTSDIRYSKITFEGRNIFKWFPNLTFYDYTKSPLILSDSTSLENYFVTFSYSGENLEACKQYLSQGFNVAIPFSGIGKNKPLPGMYLNFPVVDGDITDLRFLDFKPCIVGLRVKGRKQRKSESSFLVQIERKVA